MKIAIYLSGSVVKGEKSKEENKEFWGENEIATFKEILAPHEVLFLNPSERKDDLSDSKSIVGRDLTQVFHCDVVVMDGREKRGLGVGAEMIFAKQNGIPVVSIVPAESHYHHTNFTLLDQFIKDYTHPFIATLSDKVVRDHKEAANWIKENLILEKGSFPIKNDDFLYGAMKHYLDTQLSKDTPMRDLMNNNPELQQKTQKLYERLAANKEMQKPQDLNDPNSKAEKQIIGSSYSSVHSFLKEADSNVSISTMETNILSSQQSQQTQVPPPKLPDTSLSSGSHVTVQKDVDSAQGAATPFQP